MASNTGNAIVEAGVLPLLFLESTILPKTTKAREIDAALAMTSFSGDAKITPN